MRSISFASVFSVLSTTAVSADLLESCETLPPVASFYSNSLSALSLEGANRFGGTATTGRPDRLFPGKIV